MAMECIEHTSQGKPVLVHLSSCLEVKLADALGRGKINYEAKLKDSWSDPENWHEKASDD